MKIVAKIMRIFKPSVAIAATHPMAFIYRRVAIPSGNAAAVAERFRLQIRLKDVRAVARYVILKMLPATRPSAVDRETSIRSSSLSSEG